MRRRGLFGLLALSVLVVLLTAGPSVAGTETETETETGVLPPPEVDVAVSGFPQGGTRRDGILLSDQLKYRITVSNAGAVAAPAGSVVLTASEGSLGTAGRAGFVVTGLTGADFDTSTSSCQVGAADALRCVNTREIPAGGVARLNIAYRHNQAVAGELALFTGVAANRSAFLDPNPANDSFVGPAYVFEPSLVPPEATVPATTAQTTTTVGPEGSETTVGAEDTEITAGPQDTETTLGAEDTEPTVGPEDTGTTAEPAAAEEAVDPAPSTPIETVEPATTVAAEVEVAAEAPTTLPAPAGPEVTLVAEDESQVVVVGETGEGGEESGAADLLVPPDDGSDGAPAVWLLAAGLLTLSAVLGGALLVYLRYYREDPPLVDIRQYR